MAKVKRFCSQHYKKKLKFGLYIVSLLLNYKNLKEATEIVQDISVTLRSQNIPVANRPFIDRLLRKINDFDTTESGTRNRRN